PGRRLAVRSSRHRVRVSLDRRGIGLRRDVVPAIGAADPAVDRGGGSQTRAGRVNARRGAVARVPYGDIAAGAAGRAGRHGARIRKSDRRVRRDDYVRVEHSRRDPDHLVGDLLADLDTRRRYRGAATGRGVDLHRHRGIDRLGTVRAPRDATPAWQLNMLRVDIAKKLGEFTLEASFSSEGRVTGLFGASGAGKTSLINIIAGLLKPDR